MTDNIYPGSIIGFTRQGGGRKMEPEKEITFKVGIYR